jgi:hypothetical protein
MKTRTHRRGFGVVELAVCMIILGIGFVLTFKGFVLVDSIRAFVASYQIQQFQNRVLTYQTEYRALPGDDPSASKRFKREEAIFIQNGAVVSLKGDGKLDGKLSDALNASGEQFMAWRDLRYAGLEGDPALAGVSAMPENPFGGAIGFDEGNLGQKAASICLTRVPGRAAQIIDHRLDDGAISKGNIVATSKYDPAGVFNHFDAPDSEPYNFEKEYILCAPLLP